MKIDVSRKHSAKYMQAWNHLIDIDHINEMRALYTEDARRLYYRIQYHTEPMVCTIDIKTALIGDHHEN